MIAYEVAEMAGPIATMLCGAVAVVIGLWRRTQHAAVVPANVHTFFTEAEADALILGDVRDWVAEGERRAQEQWGVAHAPASQPQLVVDNSALRFVNPTTPPVLQSTHQHYAGSVAGPYVDFHKKLAGMPAGTLQVRVSLHRYVAAVLNRYTSGTAAVVNIPQPTSY